MFEKQELFHGGEHGYKTYRIPALAIANAGTILAFCAARVEPGDWSDIDIALRRSTDGGATWSPMRIIAGEGVKEPADNPVPIVERDTGRIHFLYQVNYARVYTIFSDDEGETFSEPVDITLTLEDFREDYPWRVIAPGPGHGIRLRNGCLLVPIWMSDGSGKEMGDGNLGHRPSVVATIYSGDRGQTWERGEIVLRHDGETFINPSEHVAVELTDGRVMLNIRTESRRNRRVITISNDGATGWTEPRFDEALFEPVCCGSLIRISSSPSMLLFVNPDSSDRKPTRTGKASYPRENLSAKLTFDEGTTWPVSRVIDPGVAGYSDLAEAADGTIYCLYEGGGRMARNKFVSIVHFDSAWINGEE